MFTLSSSLKQVSLYAKEKADSVENEVTKSAKSIITTIESIEEVDKNAIEIGKILAIIKEISEQVNLLALNASIEAARAGDMGRGLLLLLPRLENLRKEQHFQQKPFLI